MQIFSPRTVTKRRVPKIEVSPGPGQYELRHKFKRDNGFTFGAKRENMKEYQIRNVPQFVKLPSDFDIDISDHSTFAKSERFSKKKISKNDKKIMNEKSD
jgi:hypothetical protein